jgi:hypothetical protein
MNDIMKVLWFLDHLMNDIPRLFSIYNGCVEVLMKQVADLDLEVERSER